MAEWTVTPSEGVINNNNGTFTFPSNSTYCNRSYTVTYTDSGCTCSVNVNVAGQGCYDDYTHGTGDSGSYTATCQEQTIDISGYVPYTATSYTISEDCTQCINTGQIRTGSFYETASVSISKNTSSSPVTHTGTASSTYGYLSYTIVQEGGCKEKKYPTDNHSRISTDSGQAAESYASDAGTVTVSGDAYVSGGAIWTDVSVSGLGPSDYGKYLGSYTVYCTNTTDYYSGYSVSIYYHQCPGGCA